MYVINISVCMLLYNIIVGRLFILL